MSFNDKKASEKRLNYEITVEDRNKSKESPCNGKRGIGKRTRFKNLLSAACDEMNQQTLIQIYQDAVSGKYGDSVKVDIMLAALEAERQQQQDSVVREQRRDDVQWEASVQVERQKQMDLNRKLIKERQ